MAITTRVSRVPPVGHDFQGEITSAELAENRDKSTNEVYAYLTLGVQFQHEENTYLMTLGYPADIAETTGLGKFLNRSNIPWDIDNPFEETELVGKVIRFNTEMDGANRFVRIDRETCHVVS